MTSQHEAGFLRKAMSNKHDKHLLPEEAIPANALFHAVDFRHFPTWETILTGLKAVSIRTGSGW
jgi:hypothetical protein